MTSTRLGVPSRRTTAVCRMREWSAAVARSARYSLANPHPDARRQNRSDDDGIVVVAQEVGRDGRCREQEQQGAAKLASEDGECVDAKGSHGVRSTQTQPPLGVGRGQSVK